MSATRQSVTIEHLQSLPSLPQAVLDLQVALVREDASLDLICAHLCQDEGLAARALRLANSSFFGVAGRVSSTRQAVSVLGLRCIASIAMVAAVSDRFGQAQCEGFSLRGHWRHSIAVALCARDIALRCRLDADTAFTAGLLHDLGRLALASEFPKALAQAIGCRRERDCPMVEAEQACLGTDHATLGAAVALRWHFGKAVVEAIELHHKPPPVIGASVIDAVHVANDIAHALDVAGDPDEMVGELVPEAWNRIGLAQNEALAVFASTERGLDEVCAALAV